MKEPDHLCPFINEIQHDLSEVLMDHPEFKEDSKEWDTIMSVLLRLDVVKMRASDIRKWAKVTQIKPSLTPEPVPSFSK
jgi:hypothetical protein